jgi:hypothetical protein
VTVHITFIARLSTLDFELTFMDINMLTILLYDDCLGNVGFNVSQTHLHKEQRSSSMNISWNDEMEFIIHINCNSI